MSHERDFNEIPAAACMLIGGEFALGDNGENAKTAPIRMVARSGQPIEHWYWGRVVHDLAGMHMHKSRLSIDYVHDSKEILGYLNKFETDTGDLIASGAIVPFKDSDRATEVLHKSQAGVPYEASINFGGDGIKIQEVPEGTVTEVNGYQFDGPGVVIREWPLRGVAVCPYGADMNTESAMAFSDNQQVFSASVIPEPEATTEEGAEMSEASDVEVEAKVEDTDATQEEETEAVDTEESTEEESTEEAETVETAETAEELSEDDKERETLTRDEFAKIADEFGDAVAVKVMRDGGDYADAVRVFADQTKAENEALRARIAELEESTGGKPAKVAGEAKKAAKIFNTGK